MSVLQITTAEDLQRIKRQRDCAVFYSAVVTLALLLSIAAHYVGPRQAEVRAKVAECGQSGDCLASRVGVGS